LESEEKKKIQLQKIRGVTAPVLFVEKKDGTKRMCIDY
jgi:hypothetical protein